MTPPIYNYEVKTGWSSDEEAAPITKRAKGAIGARVTTETSTPDERARATQLGANPYKSAAKQIGETQWKMDGSKIVTFKEITLNGAKHEVDEKPLGKGDSFQCYKMTSLRKVVKVFAAFQDSTIAKKQRINPEQTAAFDKRMDTVNENYRRGLSLGIPCAEIENADTLKTDGCIVQKLTTPVQTTWSSQIPSLTNEQKMLISDFCDILETAISDADSNAWDLAPKNFGVDETGKLLLFDINDRPLSTDQWMEFNSAIKKWINGNAEARELILNRLKALPEQEKLMALIKSLSK